MGLHGYDVPSPRYWDWIEAQVVSICSCCLGSFSYLLLLTMEFERVVQWSYANMLIYNPTLALVKASVIVFLWRLKHPSKRIVALIWFTFAFTVAFYVAALLVVAFQCSPVQFAYDFRISGGQCIEVWVFTIITGAINILTDLLIISIPMFMMYGMRMPLRDKIAVVLTLSLGGV